MSTQVQQAAGLRWFFATTVEVKVARAASGNNMSVIELCGPPGDMPPLHRHLNDDEAWIVTEGELSFFVGHDEPVRVAAGGVAFGPKGVPHTYRVEGSRPARWLAVTTPGEFEAFVLEASCPARCAGLPPERCGKPSGADIAALTALALEHGVEILGAPGVLPADMIEAWTT